MLKYSGSLSFLVNDKGRNLVFNDLQSNFPDQ
jgi:hypothetical protein